MASFEKPPEPITTTTTTTTTTPKPTTTPATTTTTHKPNNDTTTKIPTVNATTVAPRQRRRRGAAAPIPLTSLLAQQTLTVNTTVTDQMHDAATLNTTTKATTKKLALPILMSPMLMDGEPPYNCVSGQLIGHGPKNLTGLFKHYVESKGVIISFFFNKYFYYLFIIAPISDFKATGQNWLQRGDMMRLQVNFKGSQSLEMCIQVVNG